MAASAPDPATTPIPMIICPTTHNDWDWQLTFLQYYEYAWSNYGVRGILDSVTTIFQGTGEPDTDFRFSYAEVGFLRKYLTDNPDMAAVLQAAGSRFCLLGGGITSPDNQACHGEVFIRNYLTGHEYLKSVGLIDNVFFVAWLPDDFGHDPQLPVLIEALGMNSIGLSRIPGSPQPTPCTTSQQAATDVRSNGLSFYWPGNDGSKVLTHFMPATYYGITNYGLTNTTQGTQDDMNEFLTKNGPDVVWPGGTIFATQGGDWQFPTSSAEGGSAPGAYSWSGVNGATVTGGGLTATSRLGTFADYYNTLMESAGDLTSFVLYAENYWTGYFASRPQLKIDHYQSAQLLIGAEVLASLLAVYSGTSKQDQTALTEAIAEGWNLLVPTTHHDYVTGTSCDSIYATGTSCNGAYLPPNPPPVPVWDAEGQLPMSTQALTLATDAMNLAMTQLAGAAAGTPYPNEIPVVVFNQTGRDLPHTALVEMADPSAGQFDFEVRVGSMTGPVQRSSDNTLLFQVPGMRSMAYMVVYLVPLETVTPPQSVQVEGDYTFTNDNTVTLVLSQTNSWAITQLTIGNNSYIQPNGPDYANRIGLWTDTGNIYQFGMEFLSGCSQGTFEFGSYLTGGTGVVLESGPIRWRFLGYLTDAAGNTYTTQYDLVRGETLVRITTSGAAPAAVWSNTTNNWIGTSVLTSFAMQTAGGATGSMLEYGTSYYWENRDPQPSWDGLTFRASRDFAQLATGTDDAVAAVYHNGIPAWTIDGSVLRGCLLRNTPATGRGESGSDTDNHTQTYALDVAAQPAVTGYPLQTALYTQTPLQAMELATAIGTTMPAGAHLAHVAQSDAVLRVAKANPPVDGGSNLILRVQRSGTGAEQLDIELPFYTSPGPDMPEIVTALETVPERRPPVMVSGTKASFLADRALWTMKVPFGGGNAI